MNIRSFGANCDGGDDTRAVQAALNALPAGGTLQFSCLASITRVSLSRASRVTLAGDGGGVSLLSQTGDPWATAFTVTSCSSCMIRDMIFEGNYKDIIPFDIEESSDTTVYGLTIRNVKQGGAAFLALHNNGNQYRNNTIQNVGMDRNPGADDTARGMWIGGVADNAKESNVTVIGNYFVDISGTALAIHGSGITVTNNRGERLNWACIKVLPLGGAGDTLVAQNTCSGAGARWLIGGGLMTEYYNSSSETTVIRDNVIEGYSNNDVSRIPDSPNVGINIANPPDKMTHNVRILNNTIRNTMYDGIQISGPTTNFVIDSNLMERTISLGTQWNGINLQGDSGKVIINGVISRNLINGKFDGIRISANGGTVDGLTLENNSVVSIGRDGVHIETGPGGRMTSIRMTSPCFNLIGRRAVWDNRPKEQQIIPADFAGGRRDNLPQLLGCSDPRIAQ